MYRQLSIKSSFGLNRNNSNETIKNEKKRNKLIYNTINNPNSIDENKIIRLNHSNSFFEKKTSKNEIQDNINQPGLSYNNKKNINPNFIINDEDSGVFSKSKMNLIFKNPIFESDDLLFNVNDDFKTLIKKNTVLRAHLIAAEKKIEELVLIKYLKNYFDFTLFF